MLWALLDNAVHYGRGTEVACGIALASDGRVRLTIRDGGPGVSEGDRSRLFGRFERGSHLGAGEGSGLGLYVSRELCRAMGGDLVLEASPPGRGAAFSVYLPAEPPYDS